MYYIGSNYKLYTIYLPEAPELPNFQKQGESSTDPPDRFNTNNPRINHSSTLLRPQTLPQTTSAANVNFSPPPMLLAHEYALFGKAMKKNRGRAAGRRVNGTVQSDERNSLSGYGPWGWGGYMHNNWRARGYMTQWSGLPVPKPRNATTVCVRILLVVIAIIVICLLCVVPVMVLVDKFQDKPSLGNIQNSTLGTEDDNG